MYCFVDAVGPPLIQRLSPGLIEVQLMDANEFQAFAQLVPALLPTAFLSTYQSAAFTASADRSRPKQAPATRETILILSSPLFITSFLIIPPPASHHYGEL